MLMEFGFSEDELRQAGKDKQRRATITAFNQFLL